MSRSQVTITRIVRTHMEAEGLTQTALAASVGKTQSWLSHRLTKRSRWNLDDLDLLASAGVPIALSAYGLDDEGVDA